MSEKKDTTNGAEYGIQGQPEGEKGKHHGIKGQQHGSKGKDGGSLGAEHGQKGSGFGTEGSESGIQGQFLGWTSTRYQKENNLGGYWSHKKNVPTAVSTVSNKRSKGDVKGQKRRARERKKLAKKIKMAACSGNTSFRCKYPCF